jgi:tRNA A37 methylthiotransferase MiaB
VAEEEKVVKYLDIPIQNINDGVLKKMKAAAGSEIRAVFDRAAQGDTRPCYQQSIITGSPARARRI